MLQKKLLALIVCVLTVCMILSACGAAPAESAAANTPAVSSNPAESSAAASVPAESSQETGKKLIAGVLEQNSLEESSRKHWTQGKTSDAMREQMEFKAFGSLTTMLMELNAGKVDFFNISTSVANYLAASDDKLIVKTEENTMSRMHYHMAARTEDKQLCEELSSSFDALKADGTLDKLVNDYIINSKGAPKINSLVKKEGGDTHIVAITGDMPPLDYVAVDGTPAGFNVALLNAISEKTGCNFEVVQLDAAARLSALESGKVDLIFWIGCFNNEDFEPEAENISLTTPYFEEYTCFVGYSQDVLDKAMSVYMK